VNYVASSASTWKWASFNGQGSNSFSITPFLASVGGNDPFNCNATQVWAIIVCAGFNSDPNVWGEAFVVPYDGTHTHYSVVRINTNAKNGVPLTDAELSWVVTHELGHALGLGHTAFCPNVMPRYYNEQTPGGCNGWLRPGTHDKASILAMYFWHGH